MVVTSERVEQLLTSNGYRAVRLTEEHALYEHHGDRIVVPRHSSELSPWSARVIEWMLEPRLGSRWLGGPNPAPSTQEPDDPQPTPKRLVLDLVIRPEPDRSAWNAFVAQEPRILTFGRTLAEVHRRADDAVDAWFADSAVVQLRRCLRPDEETQRWLDHASSPPRSSERTAEARHHLQILGLSVVDIDDLLELPSLDGDRGGGGPSEPPRSR